MSTFPGFPTPAAGADAPLEMLAACHERIERQCATLQRLVGHLETSGADEPARSAARGVMRYFTTAALNHHADEEENLFPALIESMAGSDAVCLRELTESLTLGHRNLEVHWQHLQPLLRQVGAGETPPGAIFGTAVAALVNAYAQHIRREDDELLPMAARLLSEADLARLGHAMAERRKITPQ